jgi:predicted nucleic acid-binding protein
VDTSALYAVLDREDVNHLPAKNIWIDLLQGQTPLITGNYVVVETVALVESRLGMHAARTFQEDIYPVLGVHWVDEALHAKGINAVLSANRWELSLVDCVSFALMHELGIKDAFAFDVHFSEQGFCCRPER